MVWVNNLEAYIGINNKIYKILTELVTFQAGFNVTLLDNTGSPVANKQVTCTTNSQTYQTNASGKISETIYSATTSLTFTWTTTSTGWTSVSGILQQNRTTTSNYTAVVSGGVINQIKDLTSNNATVQTSTSGSSYRINAAATVGSAITIGSKEYIIAHTDSSNVYAVLRYWEEDTVFDNSGSTDYVGSDIANKCSSWYSSSVPEVWRNNATTNVSTEGVTAACFIPTYSQANGGWSYFSSGNNRIFKSSDGTAKWWWTSTESSSSNVWFVDTAGRVYNGGYPFVSYGFRPALALKRSLFIT